jgi:hypothetical protein
MARFVKKVQKSRKITVIQCHLNGFKPGSYQMSDAALEPAISTPIKDLPKNLMC